jgi:hypothetical protein
LVSRTLSNLARALLLSLTIDLLFAQQVQTMLQSPPEETPVSFEDLFEAVNRVDWATERIPSLGSATSDASMAGSVEGGSCACCSTEWCKYQPVWECSVCRSGNTLTFAEAEACELSHATGKTDQVCGPARRCIVSHCPTLFPSHSTLNFVHNIFFLMSL